MSILLEPEEICRATGCASMGSGVLEIIGQANKAQAKKILIELQAIYNLPDEGMFRKKMGEFIKELRDEVSDNI